MSTFLALVLAVIFVTAGCSNLKKDGKDKMVSQHKVSLMTFNVENLFDTKDDVDREDRAFLPLSAKKSKEHKEACNKIEVQKWREQCLSWDWSDEVLKTKLERVAGVILGATEDGKGPDIVALQEVENVGILERLNSEHLSEAGYKSVVLIEGGDIRGIDVAFLSRFPLAGTPILHKIPFSDIDEKQAKDTRGILEATFTLPDKSLLTGYAVHFPAPYHPTKLRVDAYSFLNQLKRQLPNDRMAFAAGDFNTTSEEVKGKKMLAMHARADWIVAHQEGCRGACKGTSYYPPKDDWSFLDMILLGNDLAPHTEGWHLDKDSVRIANSQPYQTTKDKTPADFELPNPQGVSDHWPMYLEIVKP